MLLVWAWTEWVCIVAGKCLVLASPPSPALRRSWGKVLLCHKGLGGVFCVSGPGVCQPKALGWSTSWRIFGCNWPLSHSWFDPSCTVVPSHSSALLSCILFPLFSTSWVLFPHPIHLPPSCSPLSPFSFFVPHTSDSPFPFFLSLHPF